MNERTPKDPLSPISDAPPHIEEIIRRVLQLESERLYQDRPHVIEDIELIVKKAVPEKPR